MKFTVTDECIGCGVCAATCPDVFEMNDDNLAVAMDDDVPESMEALALEAQEGCPVSAIKSE